MLISCARIRRPASARSPHPIALFSFRPCGALAALLGLLAFGAPSYGQATNGIINGTVTDRSGGTVAGCGIELVSTETSLKQDTTTNASGFYQFSNLPPGQYRITAQKQGYEQLVR
jgi:Carboxypeptidase regulatory-like domain